MLHVVFTGIKHFSGGIFLKPMLTYDQGIVKIKKMGKQIFCLNHVYGSLKTMFMVNWSSGCCKNVEH